MDQAIVASSERSATAEASPRTLVFAATYNEKDNVGPLLSGIRGLGMDLDVLIVDDNSPDGTGQLLEARQAEDTWLHVVRRPGKFGLGTAHQLALNYAMRHGYDRLVTMDADLSHDPNEIPTLLAALDRADFVIGSRYAKGGESDYTGYRRMVSVCGNLAARTLLGIGLHEYTTSFRAFDVHKMREVGGLTMRSAGYSFFLETIFRLHHAGFRMTEVPISFHDRATGVSKIPRLEIINGVRKLLALGWERLHPKFRRNDVIVEDEHCAYCGGDFLVERYARRLPPSMGAEAYRCSSMAHRTTPRVVQCLSCNLVQVPPGEQPESLEQLYADVEDKVYLDNRRVREHTFAHAYKRIARFLPLPPGRMLEIGAYCGIFLQEARRHGWTCDGVEPSTWAVEQARGIGVEIFPGTVADNAERLAPQYEAVVAWDVLEHVRDPMEMLQQAADRLKPGGVFCFSTLDIENWFPRLTGRQWPWLMEMHLYYFETDVLRRMLKSAGLELCHDEPYVHYAAVKYLARKAGAMLPIFAPLAWLAEKLVPESAMLPVAFGDVRMYVARKPLS